MAEADREIWLRRNIAPSIGIAVKLAALVSASKEYEGEEGSCKSAIGVEVKFDGLVSQLQLRISPRQEEMPGM
jgi:hypothetical protein